MTNAPQNPLGLSDEEFMNQPHPPEADGVSGENVSGSSSATDENTGGTGETNNSTTQQQETKENPDNTGDTDKETEDQGAQGEANNTVETDGVKATESAEAAGKPKNESGKDSKADDKEAGAAPSGSDEAGESQEKAPDYVELYHKIMAPFRANGKEIKLKSPEEAIQLMQLGANYTRKLQQIAPHRKIITMLDSHGLLDESKLSFFIALDKKDPEAIKKLIMDSGIDPLDIDTKIEPAYQEGSYQITDEEVAFRTQLEELSSTDTGKRTLATINSDWDQASKDMLWQHPEVMPIIHSHRENGIYSKITEEMDRQRTLGQLSPTTSFLEAYKAIGDKLHADGAFGIQSPEQDAERTESNDQNQGASAGKPEPKVVVTDRVAAPRPSVDNDDKVGAASPSRAAPGKAAEFKNPLAMSDEDFLKANNLEGRV